MKLYLHSFLASARSGGEHTCSFPDCEGVHYPWNFRRRGPPEQVRASGAKTFRYLRALKFIYGHTLEGTVMMGDGRATRRLTEEKNT